MIRIHACTPILRADSLTFVIPQFFKLDVLYDCGDGTLAVAPSTYIIEQLQNIIKMTSDPSSYPVGILTSDHRDTWTKSRKRLSKGEPKITNSSSLPHVVCRVQCYYVCVCVCVCVSC